MSSSELESSEEYESNFDDSLEQSSIIDTSNEEESKNDDRESTNPVLTSNENSILIELGDRISIDSNQYGKITGIVYYRDNDLIRILPEGVSNKLYDFPLIDNDIDESYGVNEVIMIKKRIIIITISMSFPNPFIIMINRTFDDHSSRVFETPDIRMQRPLLYVRQLHNSCKV
jgi:uncharacterized protein YuzE